MLFAMGQSNSPLRASGCDGGVAERIVDRYMTSPTDSWSWVECLAEIAALDFPEEGVLDRHVRCATERVRAARRKDKKKNAYPADATALTDMIVRSLREERVDARTPAAADSASLAEKLW